MPTFISTLNQVANQTGAEFTRRSTNAIKWYRSEATKITKETFGDRAVGPRDPVSHRKSILVPGNELMKETDGNAFIKTRNVGNSIGRMCMFFYDPKLKKELPYYDRWPLIFVIGPKKGASGEPGFLGLNMHYLEPRLRAQLFDALYTTINKRAKSDNKRILANQSALQAWDLIKSVSRSGLYKPCVKHYLNKHVRSEFVMVHHDNWGTVLFLPGTERFERGGKGRKGQFGGHISLTEVWRDSRRIAGR